MQACLAPAWVSKAWPSCHGGHLSQISGSHGGSLSLVDETFLWWMNLRGICWSCPPLCLLRILHSCFHALGKWRDPPFSGTRCQDRRCLPLSNYHDRHLPDQLGSGLRRQTCSWHLNRRVSLMAHTLPRVVRHLYSPGSSHPNASVLWCRPQRACRLQAQDFSLGDRRYLSSL